MNSTVKPDQIDRESQPKTVAEFLNAVQVGKLSVAFNSLLGPGTSTSDLFEILSDTVLNANTLSILRNTKFSNISLCKEFVAQEEIDTNKYYEQIICENNIIPTRSNNWHDLFNGLIWLQMPKTKTLLNTIHIKKINEIGLVPRGAVRDRVTHFDECGLVLFTREKRVLEWLSAHDWQTLFVSNRYLWFSKITPFIFGHALWEMLLNPYIGLTAKVIVIDVSDMNEALSLADYDRLLSDYIMENKVFDRKRALKPMPLLGVPTWHIGDQGPLFYEDTTYFMPKARL